ncbi:MAG: DUF6056 family protein [Lachnospiraceae bacterium]|nr:DUF6056 family protein [Lachnospiraceae bacterium]
MKGKIKSSEFVSQTVIPYVLLAILLLALHWDMSLDLSDDALFKEVLNNKSLLEHIRCLYMETNGKIFPDTMAAIFTYLNPWLWKCVDISMYLVIAVCINLLFASDTHNSVLGFIAVLFIPFSILNSAGWVATSTNYIWSTAGLLLALLPLKYALKPWMFLLCLLGNIYAGNQEQSGAILLTVYIIFIVLKKAGKKPIGRQIWVSIAVAAAGLVVIFTAPGHIQRGNYYSEFRVPDFITLNIGEKLLRGGYINDCQPFIM